MKYKILHAFCLQFKIKSRKKLLNYILNYEGVAENLCTWWFEGLGSLTYVHGISHSWK